MEKPTTRFALQFDSEFRLVVAITIRRHQGEVIGVRFNGQLGDLEGKRPWTGRRQPDPVLARHIREFYRHRY